MKPLKLEFAFECDKQWDAKTLDRPCHFCDHCNHTVTNLSQMTERQAFRVVNERLGSDDFCVSFQIRGDAIVFQPEPVPHKAAFAAAALTVLLAGCDEPRQLTEPEIPAIAGAVSPGFEPVDTEKSAEERHETKRKDASARAERNWKSRQAKSALFEVLGPNVGATRTDRAIIRATYRRMGRVRKPDPHALHMGYDSR